MLTGVIGGMDILKRRIASGRLDDLERFMDAASTSAQRAAALTARLLAFSRRQSLDIKALDVNALAQSLDDLLRRSIRENISRVRLRGRSALGGDGRQSARKRHPQPDDQPTAPHPYLTDLQINARTPANDC
jgi:signal transduction histidine kinase